MPNDAQETDQGEVLFEREITAEDIARLAHPNIVVEDYQVTLKSRLPWIQLYLLTLIYPIALIIAFHEGLAEFSVTGVAIFAAATLIFLAALLRQRVTTTFDRLQRTVHRRNLLHALADIPFDQIADIPMVNDMGSVYFKIAPKADRLGKGVRISRNYKVEDQEFLYLIIKALPAISDMLGGQPGPNSTTATSRSAERPTFYARNGHLYTFTTWRSQALALTVAGALLAGFILLDDWSRWFALAFGLLAFLVVFLANHRIVIDVKEKSILFSDLLGVQKTSLPLNRFSRLRVVREHTNGLYTHTSAYLDFHDPDLSKDFYWAIWTKTLSALAEETQALIAAALAGPDASPTEAGAERRH